MEWKTVIVFLLILFWSFIRNYERKPQKVNPEPIPQPMNTKGDVSPKMSRNSANQAVHKKIQKIPLTRAANTPAVVSLRQKGGEPEKMTTAELPEEQQYDFAEQVRLKLRTQDGAREAFILNEIFRKRD